MAPTILPGEKLLCMPVREEDINYVTGVVLVVYGGIVSIKRIKTNGAGEDIIVFTSDNNEQTVSVRKGDILNMYRVVMSVYRPIS